MVLADAMATLLRAEFSADSRHSAARRRQFFQTGRGRHATAGHPSGDPQRSAVRLHGACATLGEAERQRRRLPLTV